MSILIKGMEMPKSCYDCRFHEVYSYEDGERRVCELNWEVLFGDEWGKNFKHPDCPLIEVPKHGGLVDANRLIDIALHLMHTAKNDDIANGVKWLWQYILEAPIIIEAEDGE